MYSYSIRVFVRLNDATYMLHANEIFVLYSLFWNFSRALPLNLASESN